MKEDSLALRRARQTESPIRSTKARSESLSCEEPKKLPLKDFITGRKSLQRRPSLSRIPRLSSLQQLRPTTTVVAAAEALASEERNSHHRELTQAEVLHSNIRL